MATIPHLRTTLERSCLPCIRGKRKCDRQLPACSRCLRADRECQYTNQPVVRIQVQVPTGSELSHGESSKRRKLNLPRHHDGLAAPSSSEEDERRFMSRRAERMRRALARRGNADDPMIIMYEELGQEQRAQLERWRALLRMKPSIKSMQLSHTAPTIQFLVDTLGTYPQLFKTTGRAPFIHPSLTGTNACERSSTIFTTCFSQAGPELHRAVHALISSGAEQGSVEGLLTAIQALLLGLMALLFGAAPDSSSSSSSSSSISDREARRLLHALARWTQMLYERLPRWLPPDLEPWAAWVFAESVRRTILISHLLIATYSLATTGTFLLSTFYTSLPFDGRTGLWDNVLNPGEASLRGEGIMSYKEFTEAFKAGKKQLPDDSSSFETLVTVACAGYEAVREKGDLRPAVKHLT